MAVDMFLKLTDIAGEAKDHKHGKEIDVLAWSWGLSNSGTTHVGGGAGAGKVNVQDISVTKWVDKASPTLMQHAASGKHIPEAFLTIRKAGETPLEYLKIKMTDCLITSISTGGSGGEDRLTENVTINFALVNVDYQEQNKSGGPEGGAVKFGWQIAENVAA